MFSIALVLCRACRLALCRPTSSGIAEPRRRAAARLKEGSGLTAIQAGTSEHQRSHAHRHDGLGRLFPPLLGTVQAGSERVCKGDHGCSVRCAGKVPAPGDLAPERRERAPPCAVTPVLLVQVQGDEGTEPLTAALLAAGCPRGEGLVRGMGDR
jgi:hypothetical protein